jgi:hypothetical protein
MGIKFGPIDICVISNGFNDKAQNHQKSRFSGKTHPNLQQILTKGLSEVFGPTGCTE